MDTRRTAAVGKPMLVTLPAVGGAWRDTHEGGLAFFLTVPSRRYREEPPEVERQVCMGGSFSFDPTDVIVAVVSEPTGTVHRSGWDVEHDPLTDMIDGVAMDLIMLIGSTGLSLYNDELDDGRLFYATKHTLNGDGKKLLRAMSRLYLTEPGDEIYLVTLLDT